MSRVLLLTTCAIVVVVSSLAQKSKESEAEVLLKLLPDPVEVAAEISEGPFFYDADTLYEYINGAAEAFISYDFQKLAHQIYMAGGTEVTVDLYDMGSVVDAFGIYSSERGRDCEFLSVGTEGYRTDEILNFVSGRYYVKLVAFAEEADTSTILLDFAKQIDRSIPGKRGLPEIFSFFPAVGMVPHSQAYVKRAPLGYQFLSPGYSAEYRLGADTTTVLLSPSANSEEARRKLGQLREHLGRTGDVAALESLGREAFRAETKYEGKIVAMRHDSFAMVLLGPPEHCEEFIETLLSGFETQTQN